jgi:predicted HD phosphohydrolase
MRRLRQLYSALTARISLADQAVVMEILTSAEQQLFERMPVFDRRHTLDVYYTLKRAGHTDQALLKAALLHDCGKVDDEGRSIPLVYYGVFVVLKVCIPTLYWRAVEYGRGICWPFAIHARHDQRSAQLAAAAGSPAQTVEILHDYGAQRQLPATQLLAWADEEN